MWTTSVRVVNNWTAGVRLGKTARRGGAFPPVPPLLLLLISFLIFLAVGLDVFKWGSPVTSLSNSSVEEIPTLHTSLFSPAAAVFEFRKPSYSSWPRRRRHLNLSGLFWLGVLVCVVSKTRSIPVTAKARRALRRGQQAIKRTQPSSSAACMLNSACPSLLFRTIRMLLAIAGVEQNPGPTQELLPEATVGRYLRDRVSIGGFFKLGFRTRNPSGVVVETYAKLQLISGPCSSGRYVVKDEMNMTESCPAPGWQYISIGPVDVTQAHAIPAGQPLPAQHAGNPLVSSAANVAPLQSSAPSTYVNYSMYLTPPDTNQDADGNDNAPATAQRRRITFDLPPHSNPLPYAASPDDGDNAVTTVPAPHAAPAIQPFVPATLPPLHAPSAFPEIFMPQLSQGVPRTVGSFTTAWPWPIASEHAAVADFRSPLPLVSFLQKRLRPNWAAAISNVIGGYRAADQNGRGHIVLTLLRCAAILLPQTTQRMGDRTIPILGNEEINSQPLPPLRPVKSGCDEDRKLNRAKTFAIAGLHSKAVSCLLRGAFVSIDEETKLKSLCELHPRRVEELLPCAIDGPVELVIRRKPNQRKPVGAAPPLLALVSRYCSGKAPGPSGWTEELLRDAITPGNAETWQSIFEDIVNGQFPDEVHRSLRQATLVGIAKPNSDSVRPLAMGETFSKVAAKLLMDTQPELKGEESVGKFQYAFRDGGTELIVHEVRSMLRGDSNLHVVLVDCRNAFNSVRRKAIRDALQSDARLNPLRPLFNAFYVEQGDLIVRGDGPDHAVISSSEGVRQGDVLGPLFFCIALKPAIDSALRRFGEIAPDKFVRVFAFMDDITIVGDVGTCTVMYRLIEDELKGISLVVNVSKTVTTSENLGEFIGCPVSACPKLLGSYVSRDNDLEEASVALIPEKHAVLFNRLPLLPAEIAFRLLMLCGVPRWAHVVRTHEPTVTIRASMNFTEMTFRCLANILHIPYDTIDEKFYFQARLPIRFGGLGLTDFAEIAPDSYAASVGGRKMREEVDENAPADAEAMTRDVRWEEMLEACKEADPTLHAHISRHRSKIANLWLTGDITVASAQPSNGFRAALLLRMRYAGAFAENIATFKCRCGFPGRLVSSTTTRDISLHLLGCSRSGGPTRRHNMIRDSLTAILTRAGYSCKPEDPVTKGKFLDILAYPPEGQPLYIDVTVANTVSRSHSKRTVERTLAMKDEKKKKDYLAAVTAAGGRYMTFGLDVFGKMDKESSDFLKTVVTACKSRHCDSLDSTDVSASASLTILSKALAFGNGYCLMFSGQLRRFGFGVLPELPPIGVAGGRGSGLFGAQASPRGGGEVGEGDVGEDGDGSESGARSRGSELGNSFGPDEAFMVPGFGESWGTEAQEDGERVGADDEADEEDTNRSCDEGREDEMGSCHSNALGSN